MELDGLEPGSLQVFISSQTCKTKLTLNATNLLEGVGLFHTAAEVVPQDVCESKGTNQHVVGEAFQNTDIPKFLVSSC